MNNMDSTYCSSYYGSNNNNNNSINMSPFGDLLADLDDTGLNLIQFSNQADVPQSDNRIVDMDNKPEDQSEESDDSSDENDNKDCKSWSTKSVTQWNENDTKKWLLCTLWTKLGIEGYNECCKFNKLVMPGEELLKLSQIDFTNLYGTLGSDLFELLRKQNAAKPCRPRKSTKTNAKDWHRKKIEHWNKTNTKEWLLEELGFNFHTVCISATKLAMPGHKLLKLSPQDFIDSDPMNGKDLYESLHKRRNVICDRNQFQQYRVKYSDDETSFDSAVSSTSDAESVNSRTGSPRLKKRPKAKTGRDKTLIWQFLLKLLLDPKTCPDLICWENYEEKIFRLKKNRAIARMWGGRERKKNTSRKNGKSHQEMNYDKFSRALRYHYKTGTLVSVDKARLTYKFGPAAWGLETDDPNFEKARAQYPK